MTTLAIDPTHRGFCYAYLDGSERLIDWGCARVSKRETRAFVARVGALARELQPRLLILEHPEHTAKRARAKRRIRALATWAESRGIRVVHVSRAAVRAEFKDAGKEKHPIAEAIARQFPELAPRLPDPRRPWESECERMNIFDALSFALTALSDLERFR